MPVTLGASAQGRVELQQMETSQLADAVLAEIGQVFKKSATSNEDPAVQLTDTIAKHRKKSIALYGVGREGLMMRAFAMRLYHLGLQAHMVGDMNCPPLSDGDLFIASAGPGGFSTVDALLDVANEEGAATVVITAHSDGSSAKKARQVLHLSAQTMADNAESVHAEGHGTSSHTKDAESPAASHPLLGMGSVYEGALFVLFEMVVIMLKPHLRVSTQSMRARHTNLE
jgi:6-phospho-3-hexuloisomerase